MMEIRTCIKSITVHTLPDFETKAPITNYKKVIACNIVEISYNSVVSKERLLFKPKKIPCCNILS